MTVLTAHIGHRLVGRDDTSVRCVDCTMTLLLPVAATASSSSTSTSKNTPPRPSEQCAMHLGWAGACVGCAADAKAADIDPARPPRVVFEPVADITAGAAAVRDALAAAKARRGARSDSQT